MSRKFFLLILAILSLASLLRFFHVTYHDSYTDEAILSFRSLGMIDYDTSSEQTTPWQWWSEVPWWAHLSFHDHPLGFFLLQHFSFGILGINLLAVRLPAILSGIFSVLLIFLIGKKIGGTKMGLIASLILTVQSYHIWISRIGLQDGVVILFLLLAFFILLKIPKNPRWWLLFGVISGIAIITKYTSFVIFFVLVPYFIVYRYCFWREKYFWYSLFVLFAITTPSWLYNVYLFDARGHFDFQISAFLGQDVPQWSFRMGRELTGGLGRRFTNFWLALLYADSPLFNFLASGSFLLACWQIVKSRRSNLSLLVITTFIFFLWFLVIGSTYRFVVMIIPFLVLLISNLFQRLMEWHHKIFIVCLLVFVIGEFLFSINSFFVLSSWGKENMTYAKVSNEEKNFGFNELDSYLSVLLKNQYTNFVGEPDYSFLQKLPIEHIEKMKKNGAKSFSVIIVYEDNLNYLSTLWVISRRVYYEGWPAMSESSFGNITGTDLDSFYKKMGVEKIIYIEALSQNLFLSPRLDISERPLKALAEKKQISGKIIENRAGEAVFAIYEF